jgi:esterase/lipase superfamily enzyme
MCPDLFPRDVDAVTPRSIAGNILRPWSRLHQFALLSGILFSFAACRVPDPPVLKDKSRGIIYDTAMEPEIRSGKTHALVMSAYSQYVDTLAEPVAVTEWAETTCRWEVFVATNRDRFNSDVDTTSRHSRAGGNPAPSAVAANRCLDIPCYGVCDVLLPKRMRGKDPKMASTKKSFGILPVAGKRSAADDELVATADSRGLSEPEFLEGINDQLSRSRQQDLLVFVHGFNVSFDAAVIRTAQIGLDMPFNGAVIAYCWPSQGGVFSYNDDEPINKASVEPFTQFLTTLRAGVPAGTRINILVHSMGNRIVMESLSNLAQRESRSERGRTDKPFANVALCAPDVGTNDFQAWIPGVVSQAERVTLYGSSGDSALIASKGLHNERRAGDAWAPVTAPGLETIDCSRIDLSFMGHSYYGSNTDVLSDLFMLIKENQPAARRPHLSKLKTDAGEPYYQFSSSAPAIYVTWHFDGLSSDRMQRD